ncbi:MAG: HEAT repeat domain-containing protein [Myxococcales bacterium]|nr:HEAT repeat domain-containing protein [Myxococcales bacterium]
MAAVLWDVQEEHLGEAEFTFEVWENSLDAAMYTLGEVATGPEERLRAHVHGLIAGGEPVLERLLLPALTQPRSDRFRTAAATLAVLIGPREQAREAALAAIEQADDDGRWGLVRAFEIANRKGVGRMLARDLGEVGGPALAARLQALAPRRYDGKRKLADWLGDGDPAVLRAAATLARHSSASSGLRALLPLMKHEDPQLRHAAIESALIRGLPGSWQIACALALAEPPDPADERPALTWVAIQGDATVHGQILASLRRDPSANRLWAAGLTGRLEAVDLACELLDHPQLARLAGEVVATITGLALPGSGDRRCWLDDGAKGLFGTDADEALPTLSKDDLDADLIPKDELALPLPDAAAVRRWWAERRGSLTPQLRHLAGEPLDGQRLVWGLRHLPTRRRRVLALELAMRSAGAHVLDTRSSARSQLTALAELEAADLDNIDCQRGLPRL